MVATPSAGTAVSHLECSKAGQRLAAGVCHNLSAGGWPLLLRYDLGALRRTWDRDTLSEGQRSMWRYAPTLFGCTHQVVDRRGLSKAWRSVT